MQDPVLWCVFSNARLRRPEPLFSLTNAVAAAVQLVPIVSGRICWGVIILPFAVFRLAESTADKIRVKLAGQSEDPAALAEARAIAGRIQWIGGAWIAGWAGVLPSQ
ncbi:MAG: hypothetical protein FJ160_02850 [Gammaproteobacteria bacterium]|nr:hypothetical protein [Gammaproteobacteria bacterium]